MKKIILVLALIHVGFMIAQTTPATETVVTVNGKKVQIYTNPIITADNGLTNTNGNVQLGGALTKPSVLTTTSAFTLALQGLQTGAAADNIVVTDADGVLKTISSSDFTNNWKLLGNTGTDPLINFVGTIDNQPLQFRINNTNAGKIATNSTALGYEALNPLSTGTNNTALGNGALKNNTTGYSNTALGSLALSENTTGEANIAIGRDALLKNVNGKNNMALGFGSLSKNISGSSNIILGSFSFVNSTTASNNIGIGVANLQANTDGTDNLAIGHGALGRNTTGLMNIAIGNDSGSELTTGTKNIIIGLKGQSGASYGLQVSSEDANNEMNIGNALFGTGVNNATIGAAKIGINTNAPSNALHIKPVSTDDPLRVEGLKTGSLTDQWLTTDANGVVKKVANTSWDINGNAGTSFANNFLGTTDNVDLAFRRGNVTAGSLTLNSTSYGYNALANSAPGHYSTAIGIETLMSNQSGDYNVALGYQALKANSSGQQNVALGSGALIKNTTGDQNVSVGGRSMEASESGTNNVAVGFQSQLFIKSLSNNVSVGAATLLALETGGNNIVMGTSSLRTITDGIDNIAIGQEAALTYGHGTERTTTTTKLNSSVLIGNLARPLGDDEKNQIAIGFDAVGRGSNTAQIGNELMTSIGGQVAWSNPSDVRLKKDIETSNYGLNFINKLRPVTYHMKSGTTDLQSGFIAQEVESAANSIGYKFSGIVKPQSDSDFYSLRYSEFVVPLVKAMQEQQKQLEEKEARIVDLENRLLKLEQKMK